MVPSEGFTVINNIPGTYFHMNLQSSVADDILTASIICGGSTDQEYYLTVYAMKLELGDSQTLARNIGTEANPQWVLNDPPPNFEQELGKCQRYFIAMGSEVKTRTAHYSTDQHLWVTIPTPVPMRATPTLLNPEQCSFWKYQNATSATANALSTYGITKNNIGVTIRFDFASGVSMTDGFMITPLMLSADL